MMTIALNGTSGLIGSSICRYFGGKYRIIKIKRDEYFLNPEQLANKLKGADVIINLAGDRISLFANKKKKDSIYQSRIRTTQNLRRAIGVMTRPPMLFISFSAVGIYDTENLHDERSLNYGNDFLSEVCRDWEKEALQGSGLPTAIVRCGLVLSNNGGMLKPMLLPFKLGFGAVLGSGKQAVPFIHLHDFLRAIDYVVNHRMTGMINFVAPNFCSNKEFSEALAKELHRPLLFRIPSLLIETIIGEQSSMILKGQKVVPQKLLDAGFAFDFPDIKLAIADLIKTTKH